ncbi:MAG: ABC transporter ATP-binding protein [Desulfovibrionaceae bacterium]|nr:ABC transporter ATP-binding protein [Desulfovibrionaceae bacterium]
MSLPLVYVHDFSFCFAEKQVFQGLNFELEKGDFLHVIGPNGAGKSTLLKALFRLHENGKAAGEVLLRGKNLNSLSQPELARLFSYVPQATGWIPPFSVLAFAELSRFSVRSGGRFSISSADRAAIDRALQLTGMESMAQRPLRELSGGERQRAYVAAAVAQEAEVMLLDEPAAFLDPRHVSGLNRLLAQLNQDEGLTLVCVTHDINLALNSKKVLVLGEGRQLYFGAAAGLLDGKILEQAFQHKFTIFEHPLYGCPAVLG